MNPANKDQNFLPFDKFKDILRVFKKAKIEVIAKKGKLSKKYDEIKDKSDDDK